MGKVVSIGKLELSPPRKGGIFEFKHKFKHINSNLKHDSTARKNVKLNLTRSSAGWHGKKSPTKNTQSPEKIPQTPSMSKTHGVNKSSMKKGMNTPGASEDQHAPMTRTPRRLKGKKLSEKASMKSQSSIFDYVYCSPRGSRVSQARDGKADESLA